MPKMITDRIPFLRPSQRQIAVGTVANEAYDTGWRDALAEATAVLAAAATPAEAERGLLALLGQGTGTAAAA